MIYSSFGTKLTGDSGILSLMDDLGRPLPEGVFPCCLGGGNPARIQPVEMAYRREMERLLSWGDAFEEAISKYDPPQGRLMFIDALVHFFRREYNWDIGPENIAVTNGSQTAFFYLFNLFSGTVSGAVSGANANTNAAAPSRKRTILFPLVPEYVGYADQGIEKGTFVTLPARIELEGEHSFKYHLDIPLVREYLKTHGEVGAMCVSRPTNPTGNVLTDSEIKELAELAALHDIPLMIDNAYGMPFPDIIFPEMLEGTPAPYFDAHTILSMSLSKIGLPALRTGIIIAQPEIIKALSALNSITALASGSLGQIMAEGLIRTGEMKKLADTAVRPFYREKSLIAQEYARAFFADRNYRIHRSEGSIFLWLYLPDLSISTNKLYQKLKERGVVVVPGECFFFGKEEGDEIETAWQRHPHREKCLRLNYSRPEEEVKEGIRIIAEVSGHYIR